MPTLDSPNHHRASQVGAAAAVATVRIPFALIALVAAQPCQELKKQRVHESSRPSDSEESLQKYYIALDM